MNFTYSVTGVGPTLLNREVTGSEDVAPRPVLTCNPNGAGGGGLYNFVNPSCFGPAPLKDPNFGNETSNYRVRGPRLNNWDMSLFKNIPLGKEASRRIQLRLEAFNAPNHVEWASFNGAAQFNAAGQIVNLPGPGGRFGFGALNAVRQNSQRILQVAAKVYF